MVPTKEVYETIAYVTLKKPNGLKFWDSGNAVKMPLYDEKLQAVLSKWKRKYPKGIGSAFVISTWIVDHEAGKVYRGFAVVNYNTTDIKNGFRKVVKINIHKLTPEPLQRGNVSTQGSNRQFYYWKTDWSLSWRPLDYIRVPVLIVDNKYTYSGVVNAWVDIRYDYITRFGLTVAYGYKISEKRPQALTSMEKTSTPSQIGSTSATASYLSRERVGISTFMRSPIICTRRSTTARRVLKTASPRVMRGFRRVLTT